MKSKRNQIFLLILVIIIWGVVIYRFFSFSDEPFSDPGPIRTHRAQTLIKNDQNTYQYHLNYSDPFLKANYVSSKKPEPASYSPTIKRPVHIPQIEFIGVVSSGSKKTGIIKLEGQSRMVTEGDELNGFRIRSIEDKFINVLHIKADSVIRLESLLRD